MKFLKLRPLFALSLAALLAACGSGSQDPAAHVQTTGTPTTVATTNTNMPAPDCAADNCTSLRIIDANAEAYRYDAQRRAALADANPQG